MVVKINMNMFYGIIVCGNKVMDFFFVYMNFWLIIEFKFLDEILKNMICGSGKLFIEVVNYI